MPKPKVKPIVSVAKSVEVMHVRRKHLDRVELVRRLNAAGETQRAALMHSSAHQDAQRMQGELRAAEQQGGVTAAQRREHKKRLASLQKATARGLAK